MRVRYLTIVAAVCGACIFAIPETPMPVDSQIAAAKIDFDALHTQAVAALEKLQQSHEGQAIVARALEF
jgi:hypothetical protein